MKYYTEIKWQPFGVYTSMTSRLRPNYYRLSHFCNMTFTKYLFENVENLKKDLL